MFKLLDENVVERYNLFSPTDYRYGVEELKPYLSEEGFTLYKAKVEAALAKILARYGVCSHGVANEIIRVANLIKTEEVYKEEERIKHDIRALVNAIKDKVSDEAKPFVHLLATSYDVIDTANALRLRDAVKEVILLDMIQLEKVWIELAKREKDTLQIGRTHGQHAQAITFGFAVAQYVERWGGRIFQVKKTSEELPGKFSGAVGSYNASALLFDDPERFEQALLEELGVKCSPISTQITPREPIADFSHAIISSFGVLANFSDDMRHLQRTEIAEVEEPYGEDQVGSSTMPHKRNPINFENTKSMWKVFMPRIITLYLDQISEHQRDLTNSCSMRYLPELLVVFASSVRRITRVVSKLRVDRERMRRNFELEKDKILAEPLYILLSLLGHTNAHESVRKLVLHSLRSNKSLHKLIMEDESLTPYIKKLNKYQREILEDPSKYIGVASKKVEKITSVWEERLRELST